MTYEEAVRTISLGGYRRFLIVLGGYQCPASTKEECDYFDSIAEDYIRNKKTMIDT